MERDEIANRIRSCIQDVMDDDRGTLVIVDDTTFSSLNCDSIDKVQIIMEIEDEFNVYIDETGPALAVKTFSDAVFMVEKLLAEKEQEVTPEEDVGVVEKINKRIADINAAHKATNGSEQVFGKEKA